MYNFLCFIYFNFYFFKNYTITNIFFLSVKNPNFILFFCPILFYIFFKKNKFIIIIMILFFSFSNFFQSKYYVQFIKLTNKISIVHPIFITFFISLINLSFFKKYNFFKKFSYLFLIIFLGST